jgi:hypothetical protein
MSDRCVKCFSEHVLHQVRDPAGPHSGAWCDACYKTMVQQELGAPAPELPLVQIAASGVGEITVKGPGAVREPQSCERCGGRHKLCELKDTDGSSLNGIYCDTCTKWLVTMTLWAESGNEKARTYLESARRARAMLG